MRNSFASPPRNASVHRLSLRSHLLKHERISPQVNFLASHKTEIYNGLRKQTGGESAATALPAAFDPRPVSFFALRARLVLHLYLHLHLNLLHLHLLVRGLQHLCSLPSHSRARICLPAGSEKVPLEVFRQVLAKGFGMGMRESSQPRATQSLRPRTTQSLVPPPFAHHTCIAAAVPPVLTGTVVAELKMTSEEWDGIVAVADPLGDGSVCFKPFLNRCRCGWNLSARVA